jgi:uncharacterized protein (UPF0548 family)
MWSAARGMGQLTMAWRLRRATPPELAALLERCSSDALSYESVGISIGHDPLPPGFHRRAWSTTIVGADAFERGCAALRSWAVHRCAGFQVATDGGIVVGSNVALSAPLPIGFIDATCRIVALIDDPDRYGFAYGTLPVHPELGEECFTITRDSGDTRFDIVAASVAVNRLARLVPPAANRLQDRAARQYLKAMQLIAT